MMIIMVGINAFWCLWTKEKLLKNTNNISASYDGDVTCKTKTMAGVHWQEPVLLPLPNGGHGCCFCGSAAAMLMSAIAEYTSIKTSS